MLLFVAGDIGGTNSRLQLLRSQLTPASKLAGDAEAGTGEVVLGEEIYPSTKFSSIEEIIRLFLSKYCPPNTRVHCMCLAVAGPVSANRARITNLPWLIDGAALAETFRMEEVRVINDFVGIGYGLLALQPYELELVYAPPAGAAAAGEPNGVKAVIGAGTGLGECFLTHNGRHYDVWPAEGGHADFAPRNQLEFDIMQHIQKSDNLDRVSVERVTSGLGLPKIFDFLVRSKPNAGNKQAIERVRSGTEDAGRVIAEFANSGKCALCVETMDIFVRCYGAEAGNLCLKTLPLGGLYIAGGIAGKNMALMKKDNQFVQHFLAKGRLGEQLQRIPIYLITHPQVGMLGSKVICRRILANRKTVEGPLPVAIASKL